VQPSGPLASIEESPAEAAFRELVEEHADRLYGFAVLLVGNPTIALQLMVHGFQRTWEGLRRGQLVGDADETLYWSTTREALRRISRSRELRGLLPATTADDRQITAFGITSGFAPQQQAAIYLAVWARVGYRLAGLASGVGEARARDLAFSARQEYREERGAPPDESSACHESAPLLSARADGEPSPPGAAADDHVSTCQICPQTAAAYEEFTSMLRGLRIPNAPESPPEAAFAVLRARPQERRTGLQRVLRLAAGPLLLTLVLIAALFVFRTCEEPTIATGVGRTSDLVYARDANAAIVVLDSGSGRELAKLPNGVLAANGQRVYSVSASCQDGVGCTSTIRMTETATMVSSAVGRLEGQLALLGVDEPRGRLYLSDAEGSRLIDFDSSLGQVAQSLTAPEAEPGAFAPRDAVIVPDGPTLFTLAPRSGGETAAVVTDLGAMRVVSSTPLPGPLEEYAGLLPDPGRARLFAYQLATGELHGVNLVAGRLAGSAQLDAGAEDRRPSGNESGTLARGPDGSVLYAIVPAGGIAVVRAAPLQLENRLATEKLYRSVAASTDGRLLYVVEQDGSYAVLQASTGQQLLRRANVGAVALLQANAGE